MKILIILILAIFIFSCNSNTPEGKALDKVYSLHLRELRKKYQVNVNMKGGGGNGEKLNFICLGFSIKQPLTIDSARRILLESFQNFREQVDSFEELRPFLLEIPFGVDKYRYEINSIDQNGIVEFSFNQPEPKLISYAILSYGEVRYNIFVKESGKIITLHREPYEEALKIVENEKQDSKI